MTKVMVSAVEAQRILSLSKNNFYRLLKDTNGPESIKIGRRYFFFKEELDVWFTKIKNPNKTLEIKSPVFTQSKNNQFPETSDDTFVKSDVARKMAGDVTDMCLWRWMRDPRVQFPQPIKINKRNYWRLGDLREWQNRNVFSARSS